MNKLKEGKKIYDRIEIPNELEQAVKDSINKYTQTTSDLSINTVRKNHGIKFRLTMAAATAAVVCFMIALNSNETFAQTVNNLPIIGEITKVLTIRSYHISEDNLNISVNVPAITDERFANREQSIDNGLKDNAYTGDPAGSDDTFVTDINTEIDKIVNDYLSDAKSRMQVDKDAFISTGGTEEEWANRDLNIKVDYTLTYHQGNLLSLVLAADESWYGAYDIKFYYNLDLKDNRKLTLKDVLGNDFVEIANTSITTQMKERADEDPNMVYWGITANDTSDIDGFTSVDEYTTFYLNDNGKPVVCFEKYEIAPGFMGTQEFVIE
ncbi:MAG: hypothetical protein K0S47_3604 [Herbinix sp.]|nr:hypothetical protein [Herbinix sp.]